MPGAMAAKQGRIPGCDSRTFRLFFCASRVGISSGPGVGLLKSDWPSGGLPAVRVPRVRGDGQSTDKKCLYGVFCGGQAMSE